MIGQYIWMALGDVWFLIFLLSLFKSFKFFYVSISYICYKFIDWLHQKFILSILLSSESHFSIINVNSRIYLSSVYFKEGQLFINFLDTIQKSIFVANWLYIFAISTVKVYWIKQLSSNSVCIRMIKLDSLMFITFVWWVMHIKTVFLSFVKITTKLL